MTRPERRARQVQDVEPELVCDNPDTDMASSMIRSAVSLLSPSEAGNRPGE